jgi:hypothetical protein
MFTGKLIFTQVIDFMPTHLFRRCVARYRGEHQVKSFTCRDQFLCLAFAQLTYRESLLDIEACLRAQNQKLFHMGIRGKVSKSTLADANEMRDWRIHADLAYQLIATARELYRSDPLDIELEETVYALDSTTIDLCLSMFPWANFRTAKGAIKLHTLLDLRGNIPSFIHISDGKLHDVNVLDVLPVEPGSFYVMDRGYLDFGRLFTLSQAAAFFVIRAKKNTKSRRIYSQQVDRETGIICDQTIMLTGQKTSKEYPEKVRRVKYYDAETDKTFVFLTNNFTLPPMTIAQLYRCRWQVELFFKWIKQNLRIKSFYGTSENAVKTQIWIAVSIYVLVAIMKKQLRLEPSLYTLLQILSVSVFERVPIYQLLTETDYKNDTGNKHIQLNLFDNCSGH